MSLRVLVVDDDPAIRDMLELALSFEGFEVHSAADGRSALEQVRIVRPDVVLLDVMMPVIDGLRVAQELRSDAVTAEIPIIVVTAKQGEDDIWAGWQSGVDSYVTKPFEFDPLLAEMFRVLASAAVSS